MELYDVSVINGISISVEQMKDFLINNDIDISYLYSEEDTDPNDFIPEIFYDNLNTNRGLIKDVVQYCGEVIAANPDMFELYIAD